MTKPQPIYLDHAAATPLAPSVLKAMQPYLVDDFYNPSASYLAARQLKKQLEASRATVAHWLGARPSEIIFTAGGTEANNLAIHGLMRRFPKGNIVVSAIEHESVLVPAQGYDCRVVKVKSDGRLDLDDLAQQIDEQTVLVSIMYANNEIGTIQPIREVAKIIAAQKSQRPKIPNSKFQIPLLFHTDAAQAANYLDLHVSRLGVDLMTLNGGKIYGPKQSGVLYVKAGLELTPLIEGGGQERGLRSGTENPAATSGLATALDLVQTDRHQEVERLQALQNHFFDLVTKQLPAAETNGSRKHRLPNNVHLTLPGQDNERLLFQLDEAGIMAAAGSACKASNEEPSHVLKAIGRSDAEAQASLRFTLGRSTQQTDIDKVVQTLAKLV